MADNQLRIIVLGFLIRGPSGGLAWHYLNYLHGLAELGYDVYYIEDSGDDPFCFDQSLDGPTIDCTYGLLFASETLNALGLGDRWAYYDAHTNEWMGPRSGDAVLLCKTADVVLHVSGWNPLREWFEKVPVRVMIDTDPGFTQIRNLTNSVARRRAEQHTAFFSFGENIGRPFCSIPSDGFAWRPTRQPLSLNAWPCVPPSPGGRYTTVMQWDSFPAPFRYGDLVLAMKSAAFPSFMKLPEKLGPILEIALRVRGESPEPMLSQAGWKLAKIDNITRDPWTYQTFIQQSRGEWGLAKAGYVVTRCGWFSERSAAYLATGRPVLHHDTGFTEWLPCGRGVLPFRSPDDVIDAISEIESDYDTHSRTARELAIEYFGAERVLSRLLEQATATRAGRLLSDTNSTSY